MHKINTGWLTITRKCNNFCEWCYTKHNLNSKDMLFEDAINLVDKLSEMGVNKIILIGGEPTLYNKLPDLIKYISNKKIRVALATNGRKLANINFAKEIIGSGIDSINISLKAISEEQYMLLTKSYGLDEALKGYKNLKKLGFKNISLSYVIVKDDKDEFNKLVDLLKANKIENISFQFIKPTLTLEKSNNIMKLEQMGKFVSYMYEILKEEKINYSFEISFPLCLIDSEILKELIENKVITTCCHISKGSGLVFDTDMKILPCNHFVGYPYSDKIIGKRSVEEIKSFLESDVCTQLRDIAGSYPSKLCINCDKWQICGGGCFTRWFYENPSCIIKNNRLKEV